MESTNFQNTAFPEYAQYIELLSKRELEVIEAVLAGCVGQKQLAVSLNISVNTVKKHLQNIYKITGTINMTALTILFSGYSQNQTKGKYIKEGFLDIKNYSELIFNDVFDVIHKTIEENYPKYYPKSAVEYFHNHHSIENMKKLMPNEFTLVLTDNNKIIGTGTLFGNEIKRFFILPEYQGKGYGKKLLAELEKNIDKNKFDEFTLASSLGAVDFYQRNDYVYKNYKTINLSDGNHLCYLEMVKNINNNFTINYNNKKFKSIENTENGEVNNETVFHYHQNKEIVWAEYYGGTIKKGFLLGLVGKNGKLEFNYEHINIKNEVKTGKCNSTPKILKDGRIELSEKWEWTNGDKSKGESKIKEFINDK